MSNPYKHLETAAIVNGFAVDHEDSVLWLNEDTFTAASVPALAATLALPADFVSEANEDMGGFASDLVADSEWSVIMVGTTPSGRPFVAAWTPDGEHEECVAPGTTWGDYWADMAEESADGSLDDAAALIFECFGIGENAALEQHIAGLKQAHADRKAARANRGRW